VIASARLYSWAPSLVAAWRRLMDRVATAAGVTLDFSEQTTPMSLEDLWARRDMGCVFMCGYPWALGDDRPALLASPVPSPPRYGGRAAYLTDFIVRADGPHRTLADTFGGRIAYSTEHSHSGYNAPRFHLLQYRTPDRPALYGTVLGPYVRQRPVIDAVVTGEADVAAVDGFALDLLRRHDPDAAARVRVVESTALAPSPPLVASPQIDAGARERLASALVRVHKAPDARPLLDELLLLRFDRVAPSDFEVFLERDRAARDAGYAKLA
jgi:ABC-type phosphate/phosphonate transport system substrate-binding protein